MTTPTRSCRSTLRSFPLAAGLPALGLAAALLSGCSSNFDTTKVSYQEITNDLTPNLQGLVERPVDADTNVAMMRNVNSRMFMEDLGRAWYTDHPSSLTPFPWAPTSGMPR